jgi:HK97 family phage portal protein
MGALVRAASAVSKQAAKTGGPPVPMSGGRSVLGFSNVLAGYGNDTERQIDAYKSNTPLFSAAGFNATAVAGATWRLFQTHTGRGRISGPDPRKEITSHQAIRVWNSPNPFMTGNFFREYSQLLLELTGLVYWVVVRNTAGIPVTMWPINRADIVPIPDPEKYLVGYCYLGPLGEKIPLQLDEVIPLQMVDPSDPLGGVAPAQPLMTDLDSAKMTAEFRRNYFQNSANPGGIIQIEQDVNLSDEEFYELSERWAEQHRGVRNAHRVAIIERGKWIQNDNSLKDLMLVELRQDDRNTVYEGYRVPKALLGVVEDVNRASAEASEYIYAKYQLVNKLNRIRDALNVRFLPMFSTAANGEYTWDYDNPVPDDWQADAATTAANAHAAAELVAAGYDPVAVAEAMSLPNIPYVGPPQQIQTPSDPVEARLRLPGAGGTAEALRAIPAAEQLVALMSSWGSF